MNFLIRHVKLAGDSAKDFFSTSSSLIHMACSLVSRANAAFCRDFTRFAAFALVSFFPMAHLGGCRKERQLIVSFLTSPDEKIALLLCVLVVWYGPCGLSHYPFPKGYRPLMETSGGSLKSASKTILATVMLPQYRYVHFKMQLKSLCPSMENRYR